MCTKMTKILKIMLAMFIRFMLCLGSNYLFEVIDTKKKNLK